MYNLFWTEEQEYTMGTSKASSISDVGKTGHAKNETGSLSYIFHKIKLKWIKNGNPWPETIKVLEKT